MRTASVFACWLKRMAQALSHKQSAPCRRATLKLEALEDRCVPTVFAVTNVNDSGAGSLRAAIVDVNNDANPDADEINFAAGIQGTVALRSALPVFGRAGQVVTINGPGARLLAISRSSSPGVAHFSIFTVISGTTVTLNELTIERGSPGTLPGGTGFFGGGIFNEGNLTINRCLIQFNEAGHGANGADGQNGADGRNAQGLNGATNGGQGGIGGDGGAGGHGGGIWNGITGVLRLEDCTVTGNGAGDGGHGGDGGRGGRGGNGSFFRGPGNGAGGGGGGAGGVGGSGGGLANIGRAVVINCTFSNNFAGDAGRGGLGGHGGDAGNRTTTIASGGGGGGGGGGSGRGGGGGIANLDLGGIARGILTIHNSTITLNRAGRPGGGGRGGDGGDGITETFTGREGRPAASSIGSLGTAGGAGGAGGESAPAGSNGRSGQNGFSAAGVFSGGGLATVESTIIQGNPNQEVSGPFRSNGHNLMGDPSGSTGFGRPGLHDLLNSNAQLRPLGNYGGPTPTHALPANSPAINAGSNPLGLTTDQRGFPRQVGPNTDIGAFERQPSELDVRRMVVNNGGTQRSIVTSVTITFNQELAIKPGAFSLRRHDGSAVGLNVQSSLVAGRTVVVLTFSGPGIVGGSLRDGSYTLVIHGDRVRGSGPTRLGDRTLRLFRLFGDSDGDRDVDFADAQRFWSAVGKHAGEAGYQRSFDHDGDGDIDARDARAFTSRLARGFPERFWSLVFNL